MSRPNRSRANRPRTNAADSSPAPDPTAATRRRFLAGVAAVGLGATAGCLGAPEPHYAGQDDPDTEWWPQSRFDRLGSCYNPNPVGPRDGVSERWSVDISAPSARPVVADGTAFLPTATAIRAVDAVTGEERWREEADDAGTWPQQVAYHDGTVYVARLADEGVLALDAETGEREWGFRQEGHGVYALLLDPDRPSLFVGDAEGNVYAVDLETGDARWHRRVFGSVTGFARGIPELLVATEAGEVYGLYSTTGEALWRRKLPGHVTALATSNGGGAFVSTFGGPTVELDTGRTGATAWRTDVWSADSFVVTSKTAFAAGHRLVALDTRSGDRRWTGGETAQCGPAAAGETVYAADEDGVTAYDFDGGVGVRHLRIGAERWSHSVEGSPTRGLAVADDAVFLLTQGGEDTSAKAYALESA
ncbi:PQQ-like beta-propeller repeat protein [Halorussus salilacus]|uniref:PQQ-binding-like beta-propeller repeat protein n=1 Tax=Halorussus salilacus TaxID=2953750 RepID=UPI0020A11DCB|nr:PQQ-binding-like beta-propeller repeat protein [Halorussus salilacus]USZ68439.1 PQQ-like beta-propeller repeat protein [Halorussus salilacus]